MEHLPQNDMPWIRVCENAPYFETDEHVSWTPIGQNDAVTWPDFQGLFLRRDVAQVEGHMAYLAAHGVTCIRMMMEYCHTGHRYLERPVGRFQPAMIAFWDDMFDLCQKYNIRLLITPFDTFWMAKRWKDHPYNARFGGPCKSKFQWLSSPAMLKAVKDRFTFFIERWAASGVLFGWDLWNEIDPKHAGKDLAHLEHFINQLSDHVRDLEMQLYGRSHVQTVSAFAPTLQNHEMTDLIFKNPRLDFASIHLYEKSSIDSPVNLHAAAIATGLMVKSSIDSITDDRPFLDSEHGPITYFRKNRRGLSEAFDDAYFLYIQWAHLASGAAGGGMRWPYRHPHTLTHGMRRAQHNMAAFTELIDWRNFRRKNISAQIKTNHKTMIAFGCADASQAVIWLMKVDRHKKKISPPTPVLFELWLPDFSPGKYRVHFWNTQTAELQSISVIHDKSEMHISHTISDNVAIAIRKIT
jgi:hypothetical protein